MMRPRRSTTLVACAACAAFVAGYANAQWVQFVDETDTRMIGDPALGANDSAEREYHWADLNNNGWTDLVVMRKYAANTISGQITDALFLPNVLYMNEGGVLVDRTAEYASRVAEDQLPPGVEDHGFLTPTIDRSAVIVDVNGNGWLDIVTAPSLSHGRPKHISHPRVYINLGNDENGNWLGFEFQNDRIPQLEGNVNSGPWAGTPHAPRFCGVDAGDVTGNGAPDLYFNDYSSTCSGCPSATFNFNDRLLVNDGNGYFTDETAARLPFGFYESNMGVHPIIADFNNNGANDILKMSTLGGCCPYAGYIIYNTNQNGVFLGNDWHIPPGAGGSPYFVQKADLNNNGLLDLVIADDGNDRFTINRGTDANGMAIWSAATTLPNSNGFRSNVTVADLNNNGFVDLLTASVDFDLYGWNRLSGFHRHNGSSNVGFTWDSGNIPQSMLFGTYHIAAFDITGNGWNDLVVARGSGPNSGSTTVLINQPSFGVDFSYPEGQPSIVEPDQPINLTVQAQPFGSSIESVKVHYGPGSDPFTGVIELSAGANGTWEGTLPETDCGEVMQYYFEVSLDNDSTVTDPLNAPDAGFYTFYAASHIVTKFEDDMGPPSPDADWSVVSDPSLTGGEWEAAVPNPTLFGPNLASPDGDASSDPDGMAFVTENCEPFAPPGSCDVEGGPTYLILPLNNLQNANGRVTYDRWFFTSGSGQTQRSLRTYISNNGGNTWTPVHETTGTGGNWQSASFIIADYVEPTDQLMIRFGTSDEGDATVTNAGIDNVTVEELACEAPTECPADLNNDGVVDSSDLLILLSEWGPCPGCDTDLNNDGVVDSGDLLILLSEWGPCPAAATSPQQRPQQELQLRTLH